MIAIKIGNRYVSWCDEYWYETTPYPTFIYSKDSALSVIKQMTKHYQYSFALLHDNGSSEVISTLSKFKPKPKEVQKIKVRINFNQFKLKKSFSNSKLK